MVKTYVLLDLLVTYWSIVPSSKALGLGMVMFVFLDSSDIVALNECCYTSPAEETL